MKSRGCAAREWSAGAAAAEVADTTGFDAMAQGAVPTEAGDSNTSPASSRGSLSVADTIFADTIFPNLPLQPLPQAAGDLLRSKA